MLCRPYEKRRATEVNRVLLTLNRQDFKRLHFQNPDHAGILICTEDPDRLGQAERITASICFAQKVTKNILVDV